MENTFKGIITEISDIRTGTSNDKEWASLEFEVTESNPNNPQYPQIGLFGYFKSGEHVKYAKEFNNTFKIGDEVTVDFNLKRIDYKKDGQDRKFYKTECWKLQKNNNEVPEPSKPFETTTDLNSDEHDDLPF